LSGIGLPPFFSPGAGAVFPLPFPFGASLPSFPFAGRSFLPPLSAESLEASATGAAASSLGFLGTEFPLLLS